MEANQMAPCGYKIQNPNAELFVFQRAHVNKWKKKKAGNNSMHNFDSPIENSEVHAQFYFVEIIGCSPKL